MKKYALTEEHRAQLRPWHERWVRIAMRTQAMTAGDKIALRFAVKGLYRAAKLDEPKHIVFVPSPLVGQIAAGFAAAIWYLSAATRAATEDATRDATWAATRAATEAATRDATWAATEDATWAATWDATWAATWDATWAATEDATAWAFVLATKIAPRSAALLISCARNASNMYVGGNMWAAGVGFLSFFRHVAQLPLDYNNWRHYETAAARAGWRFMHPKFCMVVDFPELIRIDAARRPHCADGPSHRWRDGWSIYHWHGLRIPDSHGYIFDRERLTAEAIDGEPNAELRRAMLEIFGFERYLAARQARVIAADELHGQPRRLLEVTIAGEPVRIIEVMNGSLEPDGSRRKFLLGAARDPRTRKLPETPAEAVANSYGIAPERYREQVRT